MTGIELFAYVCIGLCLLAAISGHPWAVVGALAWMVLR